MVLGVDWAKESGSLWVSHMTALTQRLSWCYQRRLLTGPTVVQDIYTRSLLAAWAFSEHGSRVLRVSVSKCRA